MRGEYTSLDDDQPWKGTIKTESQPKRKPVQPWETEFQKKSGTRLTNHAPDQATGSVKMEVGKDDK